MTTIGRFALAFAALCCVALPSRATLLDFEDLPNGALGDYHGVNFDSHWGTYNAPQDPYNPFSGTVRALTNQDDAGSGPAAFTFDAGTAIFNGAYFAGNGAQSGPISFSLFLGGSNVWTSGTLTPSGTPAWLSSGFSGLVDKVEVNGRRGWYVVDDLTFNSAPSTAVPEPSTYAQLGGLALLGLVAWRRFRR